MHKYSGVAKTHFSCLGGKKKFGPKNSAQLRVSPSSVSMAADLSTMAICHLWFLHLSDLPCHLPYYAPPLLSDPSCSPSGWQRNGKSPRSKMAPETLAYPAELGGQRLTLVDFLRALPLGDQEAENSASRKQGSRGHGQRKEACSANLCLGKEVSRGVKCGSRESEHSPFSLCRERTSGGA